jgi:hypothetical protein
MANGLDFFHSQGIEFCSAVLMQAARQSEYFRNLPPSETLTEEERKKRNDYYLAEISVKEFIRKKYPGRFSDSEISWLAHIAMYLDAK